MTLPVEVNPLLLGGNLGYQISRSLRLRASASAYLNRTPAGAGSQTTWSLSVWLKRGAVGSNQTLFHAGTNSGPDSLFYFGSGDTFDWIVRDATTATVARKTSTQVFRDPSAHGHFLFVWDTSNGTAASRMRVYYNGSEITAFSASTNPASNLTSAFNGAVAHRFGYNTANVQPFDGLIEEINFIDGQALTPSAFGAINPVTGVWSAKKYAGTYGTNGFYLPFTANSAATPVGLGKDFSGNTGTTVTGTTTNTSTSMTVVSLTGIAVGNLVTGTGIPAGTYVTAAAALTVTLSQAATSSNVSLSYNFSGNNWTPNNISVTAGATYDSMIDVPTMYADGGNGRGNYATLNPLDVSLAVATLANGNLQHTGASAVNRWSKSSVQISSGKFYWEVTTVTAIAQRGVQLSYGSTYSQYVSTGVIEINGVSVGSSFATWTTGDVIGVALDRDSSTVAFYKNGVLIYTGSSLSIGDVTPQLNSASTDVLAINFGQRPFTYTPPTGFKALNTQNLPDSLVTNGAKFMAATTYTGNGGTLAVSNAVNGVGFQPDLVWGKLRSTSGFHRLSDSVRGVDNTLSTNVTDAEVVGNGLASFDAAGFTMDSGTNINQVFPYIAWQWKANGAAVSNTAGSITSQVSAGVTQGFSAVTYTGTSANATVGHGLGVAPKLVIVKSRSSSSNWTVWHSALAGTEFLTLNLTDAKATSANPWNSTVPASAVFSLGASTATNTSGNNYVAYCFSEVAGFSKFGSYVGNGSADGPFVFLGFRPRFVMIKDITGVNNWFTYDSATSSYNATPSYLLPNSSAAEGAAPANSVALDILSNGFKVRGSATNINTSGNTYIFAAFAENPFKYSLAR